MATKVVGNLIFILLAAGLAGCSGPVGKAQIEERQQPPSRQLRMHVVDRNETLYSIAFRYEKDVRTLAAINRISEPYVIYPGQRIYLVADGVPANSTASAPQPPAAGATPVRTQERPTRSLDESARIAAVPLPEKVSDWVWPVTGRVTRGFGGEEPVSKGISIAGEVGNEVRAAAQGVVVYSGAGLRGYGNLLIVKHSNIYLTAYAHNSELLVAEGDSVHQGQTIALIGRNTEGKAELYFEIREDGTPVDPVRFLPRR